ncbi:arylesterase [Hydrogenophaga sp. OTU3427]
MRRHFNVACAALALWGLAGPAAPQSATAPRRVLVLGDSLSAEYGLRRGSGWVALLEKRFTEQQSPWRVVNASVSGDTTSGGRSRLPALLAQHKPAVLVIELGGNDALRGLPLEMTEQNLRAMAQAARTAGARVLVVGMQVPPNYGASYAQRFANTFAQVAQAEKAALVPFLLKGVADAKDPLALFQADRIHPNEQAQATLLANVWPALQPLLK